MLGYTTQTGWMLEALMEFIVERQRLDDPFQAEMVLVQRYRHGAVAADDGRALRDCRQYRVPAAGELYLGYVRARPEDIPGESAFSKRQSMSWKLMTLLPQHLEDGFILLRQYLSDDGLPTSASCFSWPPGGGPTL